jgi:hypothetical protein
MGLEGWFIIKLLGSYNHEGKIISYATHYGLAPKSINNVILAFPLPPLKPKLLQEGWGYTCYGAVRMDFLCLGMNDWLEPHAEVNVSHSTFLVPSV